MKWYTPIGTGSVYPPPPWRVTNGYLNLYQLGGKNTYHTGDDLNLPGKLDVGEPVFAITNGVVTHARYETSSWMGLIVIRHALPNGQIAFSRYGHLTGLKVEKGALVEAGAVIGFVGDTTGKASFEAHLHFDVSRYNEFTLERWPTHWPGINKAAITAVYQNPTSFMRHWLALPDNPEAVRTMAVSTDILNVRTTPNLRGKIVGQLKRGEYIQVKGAVPADGWTWVEVVSSNNTAFVGRYVALELLSPVASPGPQRMTVMADVLNVRSLPGLFSPIVGRLRRGEMVEVEGSVTMDGWTWTQLAAAPNTAFIGKYVVREYLSPKQGKTMLLGVNLDLENSTSRPDPQTLAPFIYVRFPYRVSRAAGGYGNTDVELAHARQYGPYLDQVLSAGRRAILVLTHETYGESQDYNWQNMTPSDWTRLISYYSEIIHRIARIYGNRVVYQIWNEGDAPVGSSTSVSIPPEQYASLLDKSIQAIRSAAPEPLIISQGHSTNDPRYWSGVVAASTQMRYLSGLAIHPYTLGTGRYGWNGPLEPTLKRWSVFGKPLWLTEFGPQDRNATDEEAGLYIHNFLASARTSDVAASIYYAYGIQDRNTPLVLPGGSKRQRLWEIAFS